MQGVDVVALAGICALLFVKESGLPITVPGDLIVITAGIAAAGGSIDPVVGLPAIVLATIVGGFVQFGLIRGPGRAMFLGLLRRFGVGAGRLDRAGEALRARGAGGVAVARMTPGVRVVTIAAAAFAAIGFVPFATGLAVGNTVFVGGHFVLGLVVGKPALAVLAGGTGVVIAAIVLAIAGAVGWQFLGRWRARRRARPIGAPVLSWSDATCPACLALATVRIEPVIGL